MDNRLRRVSDDPRKLPFQLIKDITNNFSEEIGRGAFGRVFKGLLEDEEVAVKVLHYFSPEVNDRQFQNEFQNLRRVKHPNIVPLVGFCDETEDEVMEHQGKLVVCFRIRRALCLQYMPNGSLRKFLSGEYLSKNWPIRYKIVKGICEGLQYLHEIPILHFDLKPDNILVDEEMVPKITDFGLSRLIGEVNTIRTMTPLGTIGYLPPEFINDQVISREYDIYSLGVTIKEVITTGIISHWDFADMAPQEFIEHVHEIWKKSLQEIPKYASLEADCRQVKLCTEIAMKCMEKERRKRPTIKDIVKKLDEMGTVEIDSPLPTKKGNYEESSRHVWFFSKHPPHLVEREIKGKHVSGFQEKASPDHRYPEVEDFNRRFAMPVRGFICNDLARQHKLAEELHRPIVSSSGTLGRQYQAQMSGAILVAVAKIDCILPGFFNNYYLDLVHEKVPNLNELPTKIREIGEQLKHMSKLIRKIDMLYLDDEFVRNWIGQVRKMAYRVEDIMDKYSYHVERVNNEGSWRFSAMEANYVTVFSKFVHEVGEIDKEIQQLIQVKDQRLHPSQLLSNQY